MAINYYPKIMDYLKQDVYEAHSLENSIEMMRMLLSGGGN